MARRDSKVELLARTWLFSACSDKELRAIARASDEVEVPAGKVLCEEGKPGREFFVILDGEAVVRRGSRKVATLGPGQYFGELALLDRLPRSASVISDTEMDLLVLTQSSFNNAVDSVPRMSRKLLAAMAGRLREADAKAVN